MRKSFQELLKYRELIIMLIRRDLQVRYKNSAFGFFWSLAPLVLQSAVVTILMTYIVRGLPSGVSAHILCGYIPWFFISTAILDGASSVLGQFHLLKKVYFAREVLPIASVLGNAIHMVMSLIVFFLYRYLFTWIFYGWPGFPPKAIIFLPGVFLIAIFLMLGVTFFISAINVFHEDVKFIAQNLLNISFFALPIMWFPEFIFYNPKIPVWLHHPLLIFYNANPFSWLIIAFRQTLLPSIKVGIWQGQPIFTETFDPKYFFWNLGVSLLVLIAGYRYFNKRKWDFAERP